MTNDNKLLNLLSHINADTLVLTPNRRLSATLHKLYQTYQMNHELNYWQTPDILPVSSWIQRIFNEKTAAEFASHALLLNPTQEHFIWEMIVKSSPVGEQLLQISETADIAKSAWGLLQQWQVDIHQAIFNTAEDYQALQQWAIQFKQACHQMNCIDIASLPNLITNTIDQQPPKIILLIGFTELSPQIKHLLRCYENAGSKVTEIAMSLHDANCHRIALADAEREIYTQARWAKSILDQFPEARIGCVLPTLDKIRDRVKQIFLEVLHDDIYFNISAGKNLLHYPIIRTAMQLLGLHKNKVPIDVFNALLASPFLGESESERIKRADFDSLLRKTNMRHMDLRDLELLTVKCPQLAKRIQSFLLLTTQYSHRLHYSEWAQVFCNLLKALGWPGERSLHSEEYQIVENWLALLDEYTTLDQIAEPVFYDKALHTLYKMVSKSLFQAKSPEAPIQVLGALEAASLPFDYLWVAGMDDLSWPPQPQPNPFIPKQLQRELHMPHATAERELHFCKTLIKQYKESAKYVIFSHAEKLEALELHPSPLIRDLTTLTLDALALNDYQTPSEVIFDSRLLEWIIDESAPAMVSTEKVRGGVNVIKHQALCPFKAFAEWRMHAQPLEKSLPGLRPKDRGNVIHKALELTWNKVGNHRDLIAIEKNALQDLILESIEEAICSLPPSHHDFKQYIALEKKRLFKLISDWLAIEKNRPPFKVLTSEKSAKITLNQLILSTRIDRIDELEDGRKLIIDYKTGKNNDINNWFSDRPEEPQLPLYALVDPINTIGISFAQLYPGEHAFKGVSRYTLNIEGIKVIAEASKTTALSWDEQLAQWQANLIQLSDEFFYGIASVNPKNPSTTCTWCELHPVCRINESGQPPIPQVNLTLATDKTSLTEENL